MKELEDTLPVFFLHEVCESFFQKVIFKGKNIAPRENGLYQLHRLILNDNAASVNYNIINHIHIP